jgi:hypothetical protein
MSNKTNDWLQRLQPGDKVVVVKDPGVQRRTRDVISVVMSVNSTHICVDYTPYRKSDGTFDGNTDYIEGWRWMSEKPFLQEYTPEFEAAELAAWRNFNEMVANMPWPSL